MVYSYHEKANCNHEQEAKDSWSSAEVGVASLYFTLTFGWNKTSPSIGVFHIRVSYCRWIYFTHNLRTTRFDLTLIIKPRSNLTSQLDSSIMVISTCVMPVSSKLAATGYLRPTCLLWPWHLGQGQYWHHHWILHILVANTSRMPSLHA